MTDKPIELIRWNDSFGCSPVWEDIPSECPEPFVCESIGRVAIEDDKVVVVVPHWHGPTCVCGAPRGCGDMTIPKSAIVSRQRLEGTDA